MRKTWAVAVVFLLLSAPALFAQEEPEPFVKEYKIGPKDLLEIKVFELPELNQTVRVSEDGTITVPLLGQVKIEGLTKDEVEAKISTLLEEKYLKNPRVSVFIKEYQSKLVSVIGAVENPGTYELVGDFSLLQMISKAGGFKENASDELFILRRGENGDTSKIDIDLKDLLINGNQALNIPLQPNDVINIPVDMLIHVYVFGEVRNPGKQEYKISKGITVLQAIAQAGGLTDAAKKSAVTIKRKDEKTGRETEIKVNLGDIIKGKKPDVPLQEGDVVFIPESFW
jgi:polysaccharide export outer membrane protein